MIWFENIKPIMIDLKNYKNRSEDEVKKLKEIKLKLEELERRSKQETREYEILEAEYKALDLCPGSPEHQEAYRKFAIVRDTIDEKDNALIQGAFNSKKNFERVQREKGKACNDSVGLQR